MTDLIEELQWRGMIQDIMPGTKEQLNKEMTTAYIGFDPTADSLHIGSLVPIILLIHLQKSGHKPIALVGGATGMVGDPSGKSEERNLLSEDILNHNVACVKAQLEKFLDFDRSKSNAAEMANNYDWFKNISFLDFIRDTGKHITVNYMMAKDSVKKRLEGETGMSFTEFTYQLVQGYDFYWLYKNKNCKLQMGGSDQWGNIVTGTELIRRKDGGEAFAFTCPLIKKADGGKFGKTEKGNIWLDAGKTTPFQFYQFWLNANDIDAEGWIKIFTFLDKQTIDNIIIEHKQDASKRLLQKSLAKEITVFVHGIDEYNKAIEIDAGYVNAYLQRGFCRNILKDFTGAIEDFSKVISMEPNHRWAYVSRGSARNKTGEYQAAIDDFNKALELDPTDQEAYNNRGFSKKLMGDKKGACEDWNTSKKLGNEEAKIILKNNNCK